MNNFNPCQDAADDLALPCSYCPNIMYSADFFQLNQLISVERLLGVLRDNNLFHEFLLLFYMFWFLLS